MAEEKKRTGAGGADGGAGGTGGADGGAPALPKPTLSAEIEIEIADERNRNVMWGPTMQLLRGAWSRANLHSDEMVEELGKMPNIPGMRIRLSIERRVALIYDPLALPHNEELKDKIAAIIFERWRVKQGPEKPTERKNLDADEIKTWLYGMRRRLDDNKCRMITGELPTLDVIETLPGRTRIEMFNNSARACRWKEDFSKYLDMIVSAGKTVATV